jgi:peroxiredoxin
LATAGIRVLVIGPDSKEALTAYRDQHPLTVPIISDHDGQLLAKLGQQVHWWQFGRLPATVAVQEGGEIAWQHVGRSVRDIPDFRQAPDWFMSP